MRTTLAAVVGALCLIAVGCSEAEPATEDATEFCAQLGRAAGPAGTLSQLDDLSDPDRVDQAVAELRALIDVAPPSVREDVQVAIGGFEELVVALEAPDNRTAAQVLADLEEQIAEAGAAAGRLGDYAQSECGIVLNPTPTPVPTPTGTEEDLRPA